MILLRISVIKQRYPKDPLLLIIIGGGGTGKSYLIMLLKT